MLLPLPPGFRHLILAAVHLPAEDRLVVAVEASFEDPRPWLDPAADEEAAAFDFALVVLLACAEEGPLAPLTAYQAASEALPPELLPQPPPLQ